MQAKTGFLKSIFDKMIDRKTRLLSLFILLGISLVSFAGQGVTREPTEREAGKFHFLGSTIYNHAGYRVLRGIKLQTGDILLYSFRSVVAHESLPSSLPSEDVLNIKERQHRLQSSIKRVFFRNAELYRVKEKSFNAVGLPNYFHAAGSEAVLLKDGRVLLAGGFCTPKHPSEDTELDYRFCDETTYIEIFDPVSNTFTVGPKMLIPRAQFAMVLLDDGRVLFAGGAHEVKVKLPNKTVDKTAQAEIYDPKTNRFELTGVFQTGKHSIQENAITLNNGKVLVLEGGAVAEVYDPVTGQFHRTHDLFQKRYNPVVLKLLDGRVLVLGGQDFGGSRYKQNQSAEIFEPETETFRLVSEMTVPRDFGYDAVLLKDGQVLITGGSHRLIGKFTDVDTTLDSAEIFNPATEKFYPIKHMVKQRAYHRSFLLNDGSVLIVGGHLTGSYSDAELFIPELETK